MLSLLLWILFFFCILGMLGALAGDLPGESNKDRGIGFVFFVGLAFVLAIINYFI